MKRCRFTVGCSGYGPEQTVDAYQITPTWVVAKDKSPRLPWVLYHAPTGAFVDFFAKKRHAEWYALAVGEHEPFGLNAAKAWAKAQWTLEDAEQALARAEKKKERTQCEQQKFVT